MSNQSDGSAINACLAVSCLASSNSREGQCSSLIETSQRGGAWGQGLARFRAALMIKLGRARSMTPAALAALALIAGSAVSRAQSCSGSPSYSPDFSSNQSCFSLLGNGSGGAIASFQSASRGTLLQITPDTAQQRGYAWYKTPQPVGSSFSTTFTFQLTGASSPPADGFAFVIQNSTYGANTLGPLGSDGCGLGFGDDPSGNGCVLATGGITNSVAVGFKVYNSGPGFPKPDSVFIASNGTGPNCVDTGAGGCVIAENDLSGADGCNGSGICLTDGNVHTVTVTFATQPSALQTNCSGSGCLDVILDGTDLFPHGVSFSMTSIGLTGNTAYVGFTGATGADVENNDILSWVFSPQSFGEINVCTPGASTPAPCSNTLPVTLAPSSTGMISTIQVVTQGITGLDFAQASGGTCSGAIAGGSSCYVNVSFTPLAPGMRMGAVNLFDSGGNLLASSPIYGIGQAPEAAFGPGTQTTVAGGMSVPREIALDGAGDLFVAQNVSNQVVEIPAGGGTARTVGSGLTGPYGVAVDGAGDVFIADTGNNRVVELPAGGGAQTTVASGLNFPLGVTTDGAGDLFIADTDNNQVLELPAGGGAQKTVASGLNNPNTVVVDSAGDIFIVDSNSQLVKIPAGCTSSACQTTVGTGLSNPRGAAVDAAGDVFIANTFASQVIEIPAGCASTACETTVGSGFGYPWGVALDGAGDIFVTDTNDGQLSEINRSQPPSLSFAATMVGNTSTNSPQTVSVENVGNSALTFTAISFPLDFPQVGEENDCSITTPLTPGIVCPLTIDFTPTVGSPSPGTALSESVGLTDNALNNVTGATQSILVQGNGLSPEVNVPNLAGQTQTAASTLLISIGLDLGAVTYQSSTTPIGEIIGQMPAATTQVVVGSSVSVVVSSGVPVPSVVGQAEGTAEGLFQSADLNVGTVTLQYSDTVTSQSVISQDPAAGTPVSGGAQVNLVVSNGPPPASDLLTLENNYFVTGDYASGGVALRGTSGPQTISIPRATCNAGICGAGVPDGADIVDGFLFWTTLETTPKPSGMTGTFLGYSITGQQVGSDVDNYNDGISTGTLRVYRANVNSFFQVPQTWNGARLGSGTFTVQLPEITGTTTTEGASLVVIYRVLSPSFPLKSVVIYDGSVAPTAAAGPIPQAMVGFYDAAGVANGTATGELTTMYAAGGTWNNSSSTPPITESNQYIGTLSAGTPIAGNAYAAAILSTPVNNSDGDGILDAWKASQGYTDVNTGSWVPLLGATHGEQDLFVQFDYMCGLESDGITCDPNQPNMYPVPDAQGNNPLTMVTQAFANSGVHLHLVTGNPVPLSVFTCTDGSVLCEFPSTADAPQPGVIAWNWGLELAKIWPINYTACTMNPSVANCAPHFAFGQKDSYHYVLFSYSLAVPAWNSWFGSLTSITVTGGPSSVTTLVTTGLNGSCPSRITISGVQEDPSLNGVYNTNGCDSGLTTITVSTPNVPAWTWSYPNTPMAEPTIGVTSGTVTSISGYSDVGGSDSVVSLGLWEQNTNQDMSKAATVVAGTLFHELGHTLGLTHGGRYYDTAGTYIPTYEANCKPNFQSTMNYLFQLDGVGPAAAVTYSNQALESETQGGTTPTALGGDSTLPTPPVTILALPSVYQLTDTGGSPATYSTSSWYTPTAPSSTASAATMHCDGTPLNGDTGYRVTGSVDPVSPAWASGQNITFDGEPYSDLRGFDDLTALDLRQIGATSSEFSTLASSTSYSSAGVTIGGGGGVTIGGGGGVTIGGGGGVTIGGGGGVTIGGGGGVTIGGGGGVTIGGGGGVTIGGGGGVTIGGGGGVTIGGGGGATTEVDYLTANSIVRPPNSPTITPVLTNGVETSVIVDWMAPAFGVVQNYTVYRSTNADGSDPVEIGVVNGVNGNPPATEFIDSNPVLGSTVVYTISTMLLPVPIDLSQRSSPPSVPAVMKYVQTIILGPLASSFTLSNTPPTIITVTATSEGNGVPNGLQVNFVATGPCSVNSQTVSPVSGTSGGISSASVTLLNQGTCIIAATQPGTNPGASSSPPYYDAATSVSESFTILPASSTTQGQTIVWSPSLLPNVQYGSQFPVSAIAESNSSNNSSDGQPVSFTATGPCTVGNGYGTATGTTTGVGRCTITASAPALANTYTAATVSLSFNITPAVLTVQAASPTITYGASIPQLTYALSGFVNNETTSVVSGTAALSTTATATSNPGSYPITVSTGSLAAANYSFLYVPGTLTILPANQAALMLSAGSPLTYNQSEPLTLTGGNTGLAATYTVTGNCSASGGQLMANSGTGSCIVSASMPGNTDYNPVNSNAITVYLQPASQTIVFTTLPPATAPYNSSFSVAATGGASGNPVTFTSSGTCSNSGATYTINNSTGTCSVIANQAGNANYAATSLTKTVNASGPVIALSPSSINFGAVAVGSITTKTITVSNTGNAAATVSTPFISLLKAGNYDEFVVLNFCPASLAAGNSCTITVTFVALAYYSTPQTANLMIMDNAPGNPQPVALNATILTPQTITFTTIPPASAAYNTSFTVAATGGASGNPVTFTSSGACSNSGAIYKMTSGTGTCLVIANQAGNSSYAAAAQVTKLVAATLAAQTITFISTPASAAYKSSFTVVASASSGLSVTFTSSGACSNSGATYTMNSATGTCSVIANQAGNSNYAAAPQVTKSVTATQATQTIAFTTSPPASAAYKSSFTVVASASSGLAVTFTSSGACSNSGATYTMNSGTGTCSVIANQIGNSNYAAAPQVTLTAAATYSLATLTPTSMSFGTVTSGKSSTAQVATLSNTGTTPLIISSIGLTGTNSSSFSQTNTCPNSSSSLAAGKSCAISVTFNSSGKAATASLTVTDNTQTGTQSVTLAGN